MRSPAYPRARPATSNFQRGCGLLAVLALHALVGVAAAGHGAAHPEWSVILHPSTSVRVVSRSALERIYRCSTRFWPDGTAVVPVNLPPDHPLREQFSLRVLFESVDSSATFWSRMYFQGISPPLVLHSPEAVRAYVAVTPGAIGYVPPASVGEGVREVEVDYAK